LSCVNKLCDIPIFFDDVTIGGFWEKIKGGKVLLECPALAGLKLLKQNKFSPDSPKDEYSNLSPYRTV